MVGRKFGEKVGRKSTKSSEKNKNMVGKNRNALHKNRQKYGMHSIELFCSNRITNDYYDIRITKLEGTQDYD